MLITEYVSSYSGKIRFEKRVLFPIYFHLESENLGPKMLMILILRLIVYTKKRSKKMDNCRFEMGRLQFMDFLNFFLSDFLNLCSSEYKIAILQTYKTMIHVLLESFLFHFKSIFCKTHLKLKLIKLKTH